MTQYKNMLIFVPILILPSAILFFLGHTREAILMLTPITLFAMYLNIFLINFSDEAKKLRRISHRLAETEKRKFKRLSMIYGAKCGALIGATASGIPHLLLKRVFGIEDLGYLILGSLVALAIALPVTLRFRKPLANFLYSTEYAREQDMVT
jgi:hypothetical protein